MEYDDVGRYEDRAVLFAKRSIVGEVESTWPRLVLGIEGKHYDISDLEVTSLEPISCPIAESVAEKIIARSQVGIKKYGVTADRNDLTTIEWLTHLQEELMDACIYIEKSKKELGKDE